jgi:hypothetical protein
MVLARASAAEVSGSLQKITSAGQVQRGAIVLLNFPDSVKSAARRQLLFATLNQGAAAVLVEVIPEWQQRWAALAPKLPELPLTGAGAETGNWGSVIYLSAAAAKTLQQINDGAAIQIWGRSWRNTARV